MLRLKRFLAPLVYVAFVIAPLSALSQSGSGGCASETSVIYKNCPIVGASCSKQILSYIPTYSGYTPTFGDVTCCGETVHNQLVGLAGLCYTAELRNPLAMKRLSELALLDDILAVDCHGYLESVHADAILTPRSPFSEVVKFQERGASR